VVGWETVREIALSFPEADESGDERPAFRVRGSCSHGQRASATAEDLVSASTARRSS
jgi:hypothetical protein